MNTWPQFDAKVVSLLSRKRYGAFAHRMADVCALCDSIVTPCDVDSDRTVRFMCLDSSHEPFRWSQENIAEASLAVRKRSR